MHTKSEGSISFSRRRLLQGARFLFLGTVLGTLFQPKKSLAQEHDTSGKVLIPFITHGRYGLGDSLSVVRAHAPNAAILKGYSQEALPLRQQKIAPIAAHTASGNLAKLDTALRDGLDAGLTVSEIREVLVQMYAYAGFPRSLNGINTFIKVLSDREAAGIIDPAGASASPLPDDFDSKLAGNEVRNELVGRDLTNNPSAYAHFAPVIDDYLKGHLFGDIFARDVLSFKDREIATLAALASMERLAPQLQAHFKVSLNIGLTESELLSLTQILEVAVDTVAADSAREALAEVLAERYSAKGVRVTRGDAKEAVTGPEDYFTGTVHIDNPFGKNPPSQVRGASVAFEAGARTAWHSHTMGQTLIVTEGSGFVQQWGEPAQVIRPGDTVWIPPHKKHWHGASAGSAMTHVAIIEDVDGNATEWMEHVSDEQYETVNK